MGIFIGRLNSKEGLEEFENKKTITSPMEKESGKNYSYFGDLNKGDYAFISQEQFIHGIYKVKKITKNNQKKEITYEFEQKGEMFNEPIKSTDFVTYKYFKINIITVNQAVKQSNTSFHQLEMEEKYKNNNIEELDWSIENERNIYFTKDLNNVKDIDIKDGDLICFLTDKKSKYKIEKLTKKVDNDLVEIPFKEISKGININEYGLIGAYEVSKQIVNKKESSKAGELKKILNSIDKIGYYKYPKTLSSFYDTVLIVKDKKNKDKNISNEIKTEIPSSNKDYFNKNMVLYGPPGTGKTYKSMFYAVAICEQDKTLAEIENEAKTQEGYKAIKDRYENYKKQGRIEFTTFHQSYSYEDFIEGIKPVINNKNSDNIGYEIEPGVFKAFCDKIIKNNIKDNCVFIIDEINRGNISKIFGELITLIETNKRKGEQQEIQVTLPYSGKGENSEGFSIPNNIYIIGTMNTADRSIALMDTALRRRFEFIEMQPEPNKLREIEIDDKKIDLNKMLSSINNRIKILYDREHTIGHAFFMDLANNETYDNTEKKEKLKDIFKKSIIPLLQEYFYDDYSKIKLVLSNDFIKKENLEMDKDIVKEIFNSEYVKETDIDLEELIDNQFIINENAFDEIEQYIKIYE